MKSGTSTAGTKNCIRIADADDLDVHRFSGYYPDSLYIRIFSGFGVSHFALDLSLRHEGRLEPECASFAPLARAPISTTSKSPPRLELGQTTRSTCTRSTVRISGRNRGDMLREWGVVGRRHTVVGDCGCTNRLDKIQEGVGGHYDDQLCGSSWHQRP